jgi:hypothetical protein
MQVLIYVTCGSAISTPMETSSMTSADAQSTTSTSIAPLMTAGVSGLAALSVMGAYCAVVEDVLGMTLVLLKHKTKARLNPENLQTWHYGRG